MLLISIISNIILSLSNMEKQKRTVVHLEIDGKHYYYGNLKALCDNWSKDDIGASYNYLRNYGITQDRPYMGKLCIIRKGKIITSNRI